MVVKSRTKRDSKQKKKRKITWRDSSVYSIPTSTPYISTMKLTPTAVYTAPDFEKPKEFHPGDGPHTTYGQTNQISDIVINAGGEDRDKPSQHNDTVLGNLRAEVTTLQDQINIFLTERMQLENNKAKSDKEEQDVERRILDEGVDEEESD